MGLQKTHVDKSFAQPNIVFFSIHFIDIYFGFVFLYE